MLRFSHQRIEEIQKMQIVLIKAWDNNEAANVKVLVHAEVFRFETEEELDARMEVIGDQFNASEMEAENAFAKIHN